MNNKEVAVPVGDSIRISGSADLDGCDDTR
jgi:hypothetical protein